MVLLFALLFLRVTDPAPLEELRLRAFDLFQVIKPREATQRPVVIVDIDEAEPAQARPMAVAAHARRRPGHAPDQARRGRHRLRRRLRRARPAVAAALAADVFRDLDEETRNKLRALPSNDQVLADAIRQSRVVLGETGLPTVAAASPTLQPPTAGVAALGGDPTAVPVQLPGLLRNIPVLEKAAAGRGLFTIRTERDGIVRRVPMVMQAQGNDHAVADVRDAAGGDRAPAPS